MSDIANSADSASGTETAARTSEETNCSNLEQLTNEHINKLIEIDTSRGVSARTINTKLAHINALVHYYREMGMDIPMRTPLVPKLKELPPRRASYTREQIENVPARCQDDLERLLISIAFDTGMRITELTNLTVEQVNGRQIKFIGKGRKDREVYMRANTADRLQRYLSDKGIIGGRIWLNDWNYPMCSGTVRRTMQRAFKACGLDDFYPHALRHSFGSDIQRQGADIMVIKEMMGHSNVATTQKYLHGLDGRLAEMFDLYKG